MTTGTKHLAIVTATAALALLMVCRGAHGEDLAGIVEGPGVVIHYAKGAEKWARLALELFPGANKNALDTLGMTTNRTVTIHLYATTRGYRRATGYGQPDTLGVAYPDRNQIVIDCSEADLYGNNSFKVTLKHEMIHLAFGRLAARTGRRVPLWFNEGVACKAMGRLRIGDPKLLVQAANTDSLLPLAELAGSFPRAKLARELAYQQAESTVEFLLRKYGAQSIPRIVEAMDRGFTFDEALARVTGAPDFEARWVRYVRRRYPLLAMIWNFFSLFTALALFVMFAYVVYRVRRRRTKQRWQQEEQHGEGGLYF